jgi:hypothetical protein
VTSIFVQIAPTGRGNGSRGHTWVFILELGQVVDILIDDDVQVVGFVMRLDVADSESFRHDARWGIALEP